jgi:hypothetical protein
MMVNNPLEIYGTVIGVRLFDDMFNILFSMGLFFVPLIILFFENFTKPYESEIENGASTSLRTVGIHLALWAFTMAMFVFPVYPIKLAAISYKPFCSTQAVTSTFGDTGTTYDQVFQSIDGENLKLPLMMEIVLNAMSGLTNSLITSLPCQTDIGALKETVETANFPGPLGQQVARFQRECFAPARVAFNQKPPEGGNYESLIESYGGESDLSWMGSHVFRSLYYPNLYPTDPVSGFPYNEYPSSYVDNNEKAGVQKPEFGYPDCETWWSDPDRGIEHALVEAAQSNQSEDPHLGEIPLMEKMEAWVSSIKNFAHIGSQVTPEDIVARWMLYGDGQEARSLAFNTASGSDQDGALFDQNSLSSQVASLFGNIFADIHQGLGQIDSMTMRSEITEETPILQAIFFCFFLALGPLVIMLGLMTGRGISVIFTYYFLIGSLIFMAFIEKFLRYVEISLENSAVIKLDALASSTLYNVFTKLYFWAPMGYLALMSIAGIGIGAAISNSFSSNSVHGGQSGLLGKITGIIGAIK